MIVGNIALWRVRWKCRDDLPFVQLATRRIVFVHSYSVVEFVCNIEVLAIWMEGHVSRTSTRSCSGMRMRMQVADLRFEGVYQQLIYPQISHNGKAMVWREDR